MSHPSSVVLLVLQDRFGDFVSMGIDRGELGSVSQGTWNGKHLNMAVWDDSPPNPGSSGKVKHWLT